MKKSSRSVFIVLKNAWILSFGNPCNRLLDLIFSRITQNQSSLICAALDVAYMPEEASGITYSVSGKDYKEMRQRLIYSLVDANQSGDDS